MKKLITIFISFIGCISLFGQGQKAPMVVAGKVHVSGPVWSEGAVHIYAAKQDVDTGMVDIDTGIGGAVSVLKTDTIIFYSNDRSDGLLRNMNYQAAGVASITTANNQRSPQVILRKSFENRKWTYLSLPFRAGRQLKENGATIADSRYDLFTFNAKNRAENSSNLAGNVWKRLVIADTDYDKGIGYQMLFVSSSGLPGSYSEVDFIADHLVDIDTLFAMHTEHSKHVHYALYASHPDKWDEPVGDGWAFLGGLHSANYRLDKTTFGYGGTVYYRNSTTSQAADAGYKEVNLGVGNNSLIVGPYTPFYIQDTIARPSGLDTDVLREKFHTFIHEGGTNKKHHESLSFETPSFRSANDDTPAKDFLSFILTSDKGSFDNFYLGFDETYSEGYRGIEDAEKWTLSYENEPAVWTIMKDKALYTNGLPMKDSREVHVGFSVPEAGNYTVSLDPLSLQDVKRVILVDTYNKGERINLLETPTYSFNTAAVNAQNDRFILYINRSFTDVPSISLNEPYAYVKDNLLTVKNLSDGLDVQVFDLSGRLIISGKASGTEFSAALGQKGIYLVNMNVEKKVVLKVVNK